MPPPRGLLNFPAKGAFRKDVPAWMRMDPQQAQAAQTQQFLGDRQSEREAKNFDTMGLGPIATGMDVAGGIPQYLAGEAMGTMGVDPVSMLTRGAEAIGVNPAYGLAAGAGLLGVGKIRKAGKAVAAEARAGKRAASNVKKGKILNIREMVPDEALAAVRSGGHLKQDTNGQYIGAPRGINSPQKLSAWRQERYRLLAEANANAPLGRDWYDRAASGIKELAGPNPQDQYDQVRTMGVTSAQATPDTNLAFGLKAQHDYTNGLREGNVVRTKQTYNSFLKGRRTGQIPLGAKTEQYAAKFDPTMAEYDYDKAAGKLVKGKGPNGSSIRSSLTGGSTNDIWHARVMGYGDNFSQRMTPQQHAFVDAESLLMADWANRTKLGGSADWDLRTVQAQPWVFQKGRDLFKKNHAKSLDEGFMKASQEYTDHFDKYTAHATDEAIPGKGIGHLPDLTTMSDADKAKYTEQVRRAYSNPQGDGRWRDRTLDSQRISQRPQVTAQGYYKEPDGSVSTNPVTVSRPLVHHSQTSPTEYVDPKTGEILPDTDVGIGTSARNNLDARANDVAYLRAQNAGAYSKVFQGAKTRNQGGLLVGSDGPRTPEQMRSLQAAGKEYGLPDVVDYGDSVLLNRFWPPEVNPDQMKKAQKGLLTTIHEQVPGLKSIDRVRVEGGLADYSDELSAANQGKGKATRKYLKAMKEIPGAWDARNSDPGRAASLAEHAGIDSSWARKAGGVRDDIQNMRRVQAENPEDQLGALERALKSGVPLPAIGAVGAGFSLGYQNPEEEKRRRRGLLSYY